MTIELYGSKPSPYVRRICMLLDGEDYTFHNVNVYDAEFRKIYTSITPIKKLPTLVVNDQSIFDSHVIAQYLFELKKMPALTLGAVDLCCIFFNQQCIGNHIIENASDTILA